MTRHNSHRRASPAGGVRARLANLVLTLFLAGCAEPVPPAPGEGHFGLVCDAPCEMTLDDGPLWTFEPDAAADPTDARHLVVVSTDFERPSDTESRWLYVHESHDAGASWTRVRLPGAPPGDVSHPLATCQSIFDPLAAFLPDGTLLVGGVAKGGADVPVDAPVSVGAYRSPFVARRDGDSWSYAVFVTSAQVARWQSDQACRPPFSPQYPACATGGDCAVLPGDSYGDKPFLAVAGNGSVYASFAPGIHLAWSGDGARTWTFMADPIEPDDDSRSAYSLDLAVGPSGRLYATSTNVVPNDQGGFDLKGVLVGSLGTDGLVLRDLDPVAAAYPRIEAGPGPKGDRVWLVYPRLSGPGFTGDLEQVPVVRFSDDGGLTWSDSLPLDDVEAPGTTVPTLALDGRGLAYSGFYHHLRDGTNQYRVAVTDGLKVSRLRVDGSAIGEQRLGLQLGHYMGIAGLPDGVFATWVSGQAPDTALRGAAVQESMQSVA